MLLPPVCSLFDMQGNVFQLKDFMLYEQVLNETLLECLGLASAAETTHTVARLWRLELVLYLVLRESPSMSL
jgi:hypothetical protein